MRFFFAASILFAATAAGADTPKPAKVATPAPQAAPTSRTTDVRQMHTDDCAKARAKNQTCVIDMGKGETVDGNNPTAGGTAIGVITPTKEPSLIHIRHDFIVEILKSAEDLD